MIGNYMCVYFVDELEVLFKDVKSSQKAAFAKESFKNLRVQWKAYIMFCLYFGFEFFPLRDRVLIGFSQFLGRSFCSVSSIRNYVSGVRTLVTLLDFKTPLAGIDLKLLLRGLERIKSHKPRQALPITPEMLLGFYGLLDFKNINDTSFWSCITMMFFLMARKSNMVADSVKSFGVRKQLLQGDVFLGNLLVLVNLKWSKTNQFGARSVFIPLSVMDSVLCPVAAFRRLCRVMPLSDSDPAFCVLRNGKFVSMVYSELQSRLKDLVFRLGYDSNLRPWLFI